MRRDRLKVGEGLKVKKDGREHEGHVLHINDTHFIIQDAVTREHKEFSIDSLIDSDLEEVFAPWLGDKDPRRYKEVVLGGEITKIRKKLPNKELGELAAPVIGAV